MESTWYVWLLIIVAVVSANLPWFSSKYFFLVTPKTGKKLSVLFVLEWFVMYLLVFLIALLIEYKVQGVIHSQKWEFYVVTLCLFAVFALPGFIYKYDVNRRRK